MHTQQPHRKHVSSAILGSVDPDNFMPTRMTAKALSDDSCWEENDSDFEDALPSYLLNCIEDFDF